MTRVARLSIVLIALLAAAGSAQQPAVFRTTANTVPIHVTVLDKSSRLVTTLTRDDFEVRDNGKPQPLTLFDNSPQPIRLVVLLDVSGSMKGNLRLMQTACEQLFSRLRPDDRARVGTFGDKVTMTPAFTNDPIELRAGVPASIADNAPTPLWRAVDEAMTALADATARKVILVLTDGRDSGMIGFGQRLYTQIEISDRAQQEEVMIYAIGLASRGPGTGASLLADLPDQGLAELAKETGGGYVELRPRDDLAAAFARVADELHQQYLLGFAPPQLDGKLHKIEVRMKPKDLTPRARRTYLAPKAPR